MSVYKKSFINLFIPAGAFGPYLGFAATDGPGSDGTRLLVPAQDFGHAAV